MITKRWIEGVVFAACIFTSVGWGSAYGTSEESDKGYRHAREKHRKDIEDIKRTQGDEDAGRVF